MTALLWIGVGVVVTLIVAAIMARKALCALIDEFMNGAGFN